MNFTQLHTKFDEISDYLAWLAAVCAVFGSLAFSEILDLVPCELCWWERLFMYPIAIILSVAILRKDRTAAFYVLPFTIVGAIVAFYHSLLQWGIIKEEIFDCSLGGAVSCANAEINWLGFITIPSMAFLTFVAIGIAMTSRIYILRKQDAAVSPRKKIAKKQK